MLRKHLAGGSGAPQKPAAHTPQDKITFEVKGIGNKISNGVANAGPY